MSCCHECPHCGREMSERNFFYRLYNALTENPPPLFPEEREALRVALHHCDTQWEDEHDDGAYAAATTIRALLQRTEGK